MQRDHLFGEGDEDARGVERKPDWGAINTAISGALVDAGVDAISDVRPDPTRSPRPPRWKDDRRAYLTDTWIITILLAQPLTLFFQGFFQEAGKDAYGKFKRLLRRVELAPAEGAQAVGRVRLKSRDGGPIVEADSSLGKEALEALTTVDWSQYEDGSVITWNAPRQRWERD